MLAPMVKTVSALLSAIVIVPCLAGEVTIYRETWGVPHVYADSAAAAMYAHGVAQAEDRLDDILAVYLSARGEAASVFGERFIERDHMMRIARHAEVARELLQPGAQPVPCHRLFLDWFRG